MSLDTDVLIIGAGASGLGLGVQLVRKLGHRNFTIIEKSTDVGGTWLANTYPGCGCDVASHFYSFSFALNPDWPRRYSMQAEIQAYFRSVADQYQIVPHIRFQSSVEEASWEDKSATWLVHIRDGKTKERYSMRCKVLVTGVGSLSVPNPCDISGVDSFSGKLFHSAQWDNSFEWANKEVVVIGNGCSATQFVPIMTTPGPGAVKKMTQFARQAHFLAERQNPEYSATFKAIMRYVPLAMRLYRFKLYADMEKDFAGFSTEKGVAIRQDLKVTNEAYVKKIAPEKYWDALIPKHEIGCKRKVLDTDYLACLWRENMELVTDDPIREIVEDGIKTESGRHVRADAIVRATGFSTHKLLFPMKIVGENGVSLEDHWETQHQGAPQAYLGTCVPGFPNFFTMMGPNTVTGHLSVIYTVECQMTFIINLLTPILAPAPTNPFTTLLSSIAAKAEKEKEKEVPKSVTVTAPAATNDSTSLQTKLRGLVWSSGCTSWALDPKTGVNIAMYPDWQFWFWWRCVFVPAEDFEYGFGSNAQTGGGKGDGGGGDGGVEARHLVVGGWRTLRRGVLVGSLAFALVAALAGARMGFGKVGTARSGEGAVRELLAGLVKRGRMVLGALKA